MTGTQTITGPWINIERRPNCSFQAAWTGTPNGAFAFDVSNDVDPTLPGAIGATPLTLPASFAAGNPVGAAGSFAFVFAPLPVKWVRIKYTNASSAGVLNVDFFATAVS